MDDDQTVHIGREEDTRLAEQLADVLRKNKALHERLAELDIAMNIKTAELKKEIETAISERDDLLRENELLLSNYTARDHTIQALLKEVEIKQLLMEETGSYLTSATERIRSLEQKCSTLEAQYASIYGNQTISEKMEDPALADPEETSLQHPLVLGIRKDFEEALGRKDLTIESLNKGMALLKEENRALAEEKAEIEKSMAEQRQTPDSLEGSLFEMEHSLVELEKRISRASEIGVREKEEILIKLDDAQREIFSLREYHRSLVEALRRADDRPAGVPLTPDDYQKSLLQDLQEREREARALREEMSAALSGKDAQIEDLTKRLGEQSELLQNEKALWGGIIAKTEDEVDALGRDKRALEQTLATAQRRIDELGEDVKERDARLNELQKLRDDQAGLRRQVEQLEEKAADADEAAHRLEAEKEELEKTVLEGREREARLADLLAERDRALSELGMRSADADSQASAALLDVEARMRETEQRAALTETLVAAERTRAAALQEELERIAAERDAARLQLDMQAEARREDGVRAAEAARESAAEAERLSAEAERQGQELALLRQQLQVAEEGLRDSEALRETLRQREAEILRLAAVEEGLRSRLSETSLMADRLAEMEDRLKASLADRDNLLRLTEENRQLSAQLADRAAGSPPMDELKATVTAEITRLTDQLRRLQEEHTEDRAALRDGLKDALARLAESADRIDHAVAEGLASARMQGGNGELPSANLPALSAAQDTDAAAPSPRWGIAVAALFAFVLAVAAAGYYYKTALLPVADARKDTAPAAPEWAAGVKTAAAGGYEISLTFLNREAVAVLGYADILPDALLAANYAALVTVSGSKGCIPEEFVSSPETFISFMTAQGSEVAADRTGAFSREKRTIFRKDACAGKPGAVYLKHIVLTPRQTGLSGVSIKGLAQGPVILR